MTGFSDKQVRALSRRVPERNIRSRMSNGKELSYIEGWYALAEANRIFGFDGWDRETVEIKCVLAREVRSTWTAVYFARVRINVRTDDRTIIRDGHGTGEAYGPTAGEVHDRALKAAETDATKRALATFGKAFGLALYANTHRAATNSQRAAATATTLPARAKTIAAEEPSHITAGDMGLPAVREVAGRGPSRQNGSPSRGLSASGTFLPRARIDKSALAFPEPKRVRSKDHLRRVAAQPCLLCSATPSDAHHLRFAQPRAMNLKVGDEFTVPLCRTHHRELHHGGSEVAWWHDMGIDPVEIAKRLWAESEIAQTGPT